MADLIAEGVSHAAAWARCRLWPTDPACNQELQAYLAARDRLAAEDVQRRVEKAEQELAKAKQLARGESPTNSAQQLEARIAEAWHARKKEIYSQLPDDDSFQYGPLSSIEAKKVLKLQKKLAHAVFRRDSLMALL